MKSHRHLFGQKAEGLAAKLLQKKGYRIIGRNVRLPGGELDMVAQLDEVVVFVEVKARRTELHGGALHAVSGEKEHRLIKLAAQYRSQHDLGQQSCRFDVILCQETPDGTLAIDHIENAFEVAGQDLRW